VNDPAIEWNATGGTSYDVQLKTATPSADRTITLPDATGTVLTTGNSDTPTTTTSSSDADFVLIDDGGTMKKITPTNLGIGGGGGGGSTAADDITTGDAAVSIATTSGNITIDAQGSDTDIIFKGTDSSSDITALTLDMSDAGKAIFNSGGTFSGDVTLTGDNYNVVWDKSEDRLEFADNASATFGAGADLRLFHNGSISYIQDAGTGGLRIIGNLITLLNAANDETMLVATEDGAVELYHNNVKKLETTTAGATITGYLRQSSVQAASVQLTTGNSQDSSNPYTTTGVAIKWDLEHYNSGCYSASTGHFTAPVDGVYEMNVSAISASGVINFSVMYNDGSSDTDLASGYANSSYFTGVVHVIKQMDAGDYMFVKLESGENIYIQSGTGNFNGATFKLLG